MKPNMSPIWAGLMIVPITRPKHEKVPAASSVMASRLPSSRTSRPGIGPIIKRATGSTKSAAITPWTTPDRTFSSATSSSSRASNCLSEISGEAST